jgi:hypothetical protein
MRLVLAIQCFFMVLFSKRLPKGAVALLPAAATPETEKALPASADPQPAAVEARRRSEDVVRGAVQLLAILQREGRLLDFLQEEIDGYQDAQIGAAVRDIHRGCKKAIADHLPIEPVLRDAENATVRVDPGFDPSRIRLVGNVLGEPPYTGTLRHHGWRTGKVTLPAAGVATDPTVVAPAEVEIS